MKTFYVETNRELKIDFCTFSLNFSYLFLKKNRQTNPKRFSFLHDSQKIMQIEANQVLGLELATIY
jgi:DNA mismatch repair ATPase MutS